MSTRWWMGWIVALPLAGACTADDDASGDTEAGTSTGTGTQTGEDPTTGTSVPQPTTDPSTTGDPSTTDDTTTGATSLPGSTSGTDTDGDTETDTEGEPAGPMVDLSDPQLYSFSFTPDEADETAGLALGTQSGYLDTRVDPRGKLVVYLHGAGAPNNCGSGTHAEVLAGMGFHVFQPCYVSDYGVGNCGDDIGGCRLEAFEGVDHHDLIEITPPDSTETRIVRGLQHLQELHPGGDWQYYLDGESPRWDQIIISGISHGASSSGVVGMNRDVHRVVMLSGPLDTNQAWLLGDPITPIDRFFAFTHTGDSQHPGHLEAFIDMNLPGDPVVVDDMDPPYGDSHRLVSSADTGNGHTAVQAGGSSPQDGGEWVYLPVWQYLYGTL